MLNGPWKSVSVKERVIKISNLVVFVENGACEVRECSDTSKECELSPTILLFVIKSPASVSSDIAQLCHQDSSIS